MGISYVCPKCEGSRKGGIVIWVRLSNEYWCWNCAKHFKLSELKLRIL